MRGREQLLAAVAQELMLISRHQLASATRGTLERSAYLMLNRIDATGPMTARELAAALHLEISTVTRQVAAMLRENVVERIPDPSGGQAKRLRITATGVAQLTADRELYRTRPAPPAASREREHRTAAGQPLAPGRLIRPIFQPIESLPRNSSRKDRPWYTSRRVTGPRRSRKRMCESIDL
jgi:DNA-binding MarR family transcriptional regulator